MIEMKEQAFEKIYKQTFDQTEKDFKRNSSDHQYLFSCCF
ncbi:hypothetical protein CUZ96_1075 [Enterococcus lactis]|nr:hypothetical protein [Enterococcus faecium]MBK4845240.1 hypothetical protein [Enterococcus faecium]MBL5011412.1 hypothetical protein [Enterococcus lactis]